MNPFTLIIRAWRESAREAALYRAHLEVSRWLAAHVDDVEGWLLYERPWTQAWTNDPLEEAREVGRFTADWGFITPMTVVYVSGRSPFRGDIHGLGFFAAGIAIVDSLNPGVLAHELGHLMGRGHSAKGSGDIMDDGAWPYRDWPQIPWEA